jgi:RNA polymerase sigma-70 factor (ECF subfamily)
MSIPDTELVERARSGDVRAFEELYRRHGARVYSLARRLTGSQDDAADVTQHTFVKAWGRLKSLRSPEAFAGWLHRIALNAVRDRAKRPQEVPIADAAEASLGEATEDAADEASRGELRRKVEAAVQSLPEKHREVVVMHHVEGLDVMEVAEALGVPKGTVLSRLARARDTLRRKLSSYVEG